MSLAATLQKDFLRGLWGKSWVGPDEFSFPQTSGGRGSRIYCSYEVYGHVLEALLT